MCGFSFFKFNLYPYVNSAQIICYSFPDEEQILILHFGPAWLVTTLLISRDRKRHVKKKNPNLYPLWQNRLTMNTSVSIINTTISYNNIYYSTDSDFSYLLKSLPELHTASKFLKKFCKLQISAGLYFRIVNSCSKWSLNSFFFLSFFAFVGIYFSSSISRRTS